MVHHFLDGSVPVPPVQIEDVDVRRAQLSQTCFDADLQALRIVPCVVDFVFYVGVRALEVRRVLEYNEQEG